MPTSLEHLRHHCYSIEKTEGTGVSTKAKVSSGMGQTTHSSFTGNLTMGKGETLMGENPTTQPTPTGLENGLSLSAKLFLVLTIGSGLCLFVNAATNWPQGEWFRFAFYALAAACAAGWKVRLPGVEATLSVNFFFNLLAAAELGFSEAVAIAGLGGAVQSWWRPNHKPEPIQIPFNISVLAVSSGAASLVFNSALVHAWHLELIPRIAVAAAAQFFTNSLFVSSIIVLTQRTQLLPTLRGMMWSFPYYFVAAMGVGLFHGLSSFIGWQSALLSLPAAWMVFRGFQLYLDRMDAQQRHARQMSELQRRTIEALALAIECKDETTHQHLSRVQVYALAIGEELKLTSDEMEALRAASLLHDIGKLAVPESIINKPGRLTSEEFNKMKIHPGVGAEILSSVQFPYPVVPFVRSHHEKWDGSGYPDGLAGEAIPVGSRIIAVVDCLDALASDRQYRRALPLPQAMDIVRKESGRAFDPRIVRILDERYVEFEAKARLQSALLPKLSLDLHIERGGAPGAGFAAQAAVFQGGSLAALASAIEGRDSDTEDAVRMIRELAPRLGFEELVALADMRLRRLIVSDGVVAYRLRDGDLCAAYASGEDSRLFACLRVPFGQGLSGWVAENRRPILNGNPGVEPGYAGGSLRSALAVPIEADGAVIGVLALHSTMVDAFCEEDCRVLTGIASALGTPVAVEATRIPVSTGK